MYFQHASMAAMKYLVLLFAFAVFLPKIPGQHNSDSLLRYAESTTNDSLRAETFLLLSASTWRSVPARSKVFAKKALLISRKVNSPELLAKSFNYLGIIYDVTSQSDSALWCYRQCILLSDKHGLQVMKAQALNNVGLVYWNRGERDSAISSYIESLKIFEKNGKEKGVANTLNNIGLLFVEKKEFRQGMQYHRRALDIRKKIDDRYGMGASLSNIAQIYSELGYIDSARASLRLSSQYKKEVNDRHGLAINYNALGITFREQGKMDSAVANIKKSIDLFDELGNVQLSAANHRTLAGLYIIMKRYYQARVNLERAKELAAQVGAKRVLMGIYEDELELDTLTGDYKKAIQTFSRLYDVHRDIYSMERERMISEIETRYETEKKEKELAQNKAALALEQVRVKQRTNWLVLLVALAIIILISAIYTYGQQRFKQAQLKEEARLKEHLARSELQNQIQEERVRISRDLHDHVGAQLTIISSAIDNLAFRELDIGRKQKFENVSDCARQTIGQLRETIWAMSNEDIDLNSLEVRLREFVSQVDTHREVQVVNKTGENPRLGPTVALNLYRVCQEAINNALKYADFQKMSLIFTKQGEEMVLTIEDDGRGFEPAEALGKGNGLNNMKERVQALGGILEVKSVVDKGTTIGVRLSPEYDKLRIV